jgi:hypothetical protein
VYMLQHSKAFGFVRIIEALTWPLEEQDEINLSV